MARPIRHVPRDSSRRRLWVYFAVAVFILADVALIAYALNFDRSITTAEQPRPVPTFANQVSSAPPAAPAAESTSVPAAVPIVAVPPTRFLSAVDDTTAWRAVTGECPSSPVAPEFTTDAGVAWTFTNATDQTDVTALQGLIASSESIVQLVGLAAADCEPQFVQTFVGGDTFKSYPEKLEGAWFIDPADRAFVHSPTGDSAAPCPAMIALAPRDAESAAVLCDDQTIFTTTDAAATWSSPMTLAGAVAITASDTGYLAAAVGRAECAGVQLQTITPALISTEQGCFKTAAQPAQLSGTVAVSSASGTIWLWAGDAFTRSADGGVNWE